MPTLNIASLVDPFVQPAFDAPSDLLWNATWKLHGEMAHHVDVYRVCGLGSRIISHDTLLWAPISHYYIFAALSAYDRVRKKSPVAISAELGAVMRKGDIDRARLRKQECIREYAQGIDSAWKEQHGLIMSTLVELLSTRAIKNPMQSIPEYARVGKSH